MHQSNLFDQFEQSVARLDIPDVRKIAKVENVRWFLRNGWIGNKSHKDFSRAREVAVKIAALN